MVSAVSNIKKRADFRTVVLNPGAFEELIIFSMETQTECLSMAGAWRVEESVNSYESGQVLYSGLIWLQAVEAQLRELKYKREIVGWLKSMSGAGLKGSEMRPSGLFLCSLTLLSSVCWSYSPPFQRRVLHMDGKRQGMIRGSSRFTASQFSY